MRESLAYAGTLSLFIVSEKAVLVSLLKLSFYHMLAAIVTQILNAT